ncbi:MAG: anthranilate phosphoribosyltransferase [Dehalococcoidia bacterium]|nr:anthranilate phosphoribosyltransferase [Dehalococcoidia bacterium]
MIQEAIRALVDGRAIGAEQAAGAIEEIMGGEATPAQIGAFLAALRLHGETPEIIAACLGVLERHAIAVPADNVIDVVGTGGDLADTFNVSTAAAIVVAGAGVRVAKHGNRAASSKCGSADVLEALGGKLELDGAAAAKVVDGAGFCFLFAQRFHPAMRHAGGPRREIAVRTIFNVLGPLANPARPQAMLVGVGAKAFGPLMAETFRLRGMERAMVIHSEDGLDEISPAAPSHAWVLENGRLSERTISPADFGLPGHALDAVVGGDAMHNSGQMNAVLDGAEGPVTDFVLMSASAALYVAGKTSDFREGVAIARESIASGRAREVLDRYVALSQELGQ